MATETWSDFKEQLPSRPDWQRNISLLVDEMDSGKRMEREVSYG